MIINDFNKIKKLIYLSKNNNELYDIDTRIKTLKNIKYWILEHKQDIFNALKKDLNKSDIESHLSEIAIVLNLINFYVKEIKKFFKEKKVASNKMEQLFSKSYTIYKPKGITLLINPFNYPFHLSILPWVTNIACGNYTFFKNSPKTPNINDVIQRLIMDVANSHTYYLNDLTSKEELFKIIGSKINLVFFTGGESFGNILKTECDKNNVKVILELGSACPVIVDKTANIDEFAKRIVWAKLFNMGQTCVAPNSIFIEESIYKITINKIWEQFNIQCFNNKNYEFTRLIDITHLNTIRKNIEPRFKLEVNETNLTIKPTIIEVLEDDKLLTTEIFGPIFFATKFKNKIEFIRKHKEKIDDSLALYLFSEDRSYIDLIKKELNFGTLSINEALIHVNNFNLPFGGINKSGIGKYHGIVGLMEFSNLCSISIGSKVNIKARYFNNINKYKKMLMKNK